MLATKFVNTHPFIVMNREVNQLKRILLITGRPGIGKTSVLLRAIEELRAKGVDIGGMLSREIREQGVRVGFEIVDFCSGQKGWLAHASQPVGPKIGKYRVNLNDLNHVGAVSIRNAAKNNQIIVVDEVGPMELFSQAFREAVAEAANSGKPLLGTIHFKAHDSLINLIKNRDDTEIIEVTFENRGRLHSVLVDKVVESLKKITPTSNSQREST
ncbi:MAG: NTPase [Candidatus Bathyarchaeota archaeon]|nr:MAG: NTPase [Candidatus Bathyarchaeota archaeon]